MMRAIAFSLLTWLLLSGVEGTGPVVPPQLNTTTCSVCLRSAVRYQVLDSLAKRYALGSFDGLLLYLSVYPGVRLPLLNASETRAFDRWSKAFWPSEALLATALAQRAVANQVLIFCFVGLADVPF
jgi:hypothetical protein